MPANEMSKEELEGVFALVHSLGPYFDRELAELGRLEADYCVENAEKPRCASRRLRSLHKEPHSSRSAS